MQRPTQRLENALHKQGFSLIAGCDEAGRGAWAGPLVAAAVILPERYRLPGLRDSKLLTPSARETLYDAVVSVAVAWNVAVFDVEHIDAGGVHAANKQALRAALLGLSPLPDHALVDGFDIQPIALPTMPVIDGDATVRSIAAASILAKVTRDRIMVALHQALPQYGFDRHKGYGTPEHSRALGQYGPTEHHRTSFAPIIEYLRRRRA